MRAGKERKDAMKSMADRVDLEDVSSWVTMLIQTDRLGTSISQALRVHSDSLRVKRSQRLEEMAAKVPVKLLFPTIFCIFPSLFVVILGPAFIRILRVLSEL
jgi:tight adherence protein C